LVLQLLLLLLAEFGSNLSTSTCIKVNSAAAAAAA
jgi:hypothetical protein